MRRIHPKNGPLLQLPKEHPAHATLIARLECQRECASREIDCPGQDGGVDQNWQSLLDGRERTFSGFIYEFVCFDLILTEWIEHPPYLTLTEENALSWFPKLFGMLDECEAAAARDANVPVLKMLPLARRFFPSGSKRFG